MSLPESLSEVDGLPKAEVVHYSSPALGRNPRQAQLLAGSSQEGRGLRVRKWLLQRADLMLSAHQLFAAGSLEGPPEQCTSVPVTLSLCFICPAFWLDVLRFG